ncbi:transglutaminase family protein, partial [Thauera aminoaromatica]
VHLSPVDTPTQTVRSHTLTISPEPAARSQTTDAFGNLRTFFSLQAPHEVLTVTADTRVDTRAPAPLPDDPAWQMQTWEAVRDHFRYRARAPYDPASEFLFASPHVPRDDAFTAFARPAFENGLPMLSAVLALMERIHSGLTYETASTEVNTPALVALAQGKGVCQDFAHIMTGCLRSLGLPARYVSGYLLTEPPPGQPRLIGADASHAWVALWCPGAGWIDIDPTNDLQPGSGHITLAWGRDYGDVCPLRGVILGGGGHGVEVAVTVMPVEEGPPPRRGGRPARAADAPD